jgi:hypothetical protein
LRTFSGVSDFETARPRYAQVLGSNLPPPSLPSRESRPSSSAPSASFTEGGGALDPTDILSPEAAAWELHNLDTSTPTVDDPEDLLFMLDPPGSAGAADPVFELGLDDLIDEASSIVGGLDGAEGAAPGDALRDVFEDSAPSGTPPADFLADVNDVDDAAVSGVPTALAGNPAVADTLQQEADPRPSAPVDLPGGESAPDALASVANAPGENPDA